MDNDRIVSFLDVSFPKNELIIGAGSSFREENSICEKGDVDIIVASTIISTPYTEMLPCGNEQYHITVIPMTRLAEIIKEDVVLGMGILSNMIVSGVALKDNRGIFPRLVDFSRYVKIAYFPEYNSDQVKNKLILLSTLIDDYRIDRPPISRMFIVGDIIRIVADMLANKSHVHLGVGKHKAIFLSQSDASFQTIVERLYQEGGSVERETEVIRYATDFVGLFPDFKTDAYTSRDGLSPVFSDKTELTILIPSGHVQTGAIHAQLLQFNTWLVSHGGRLVFYSLKFDYVFIRISFRGVKYIFLFSIVSRLFSIERSKLNDVRIVSFATEYYDPALGPLVTNVLKLSSLIKSYQDRRRVQAFFLRDVLAKESATNGGEDLIKTLVELWVPLKIDVSSKLDYLSLYDLYRVSDTYEHRKGAPLDSSDLSERESSLLEACLAVYSSIREDSFDERMIEIERDVLSRGVERGSHSIIVAKKISIVMRLIDFEYFNIDVLSKCLYGEYK